MRLFKNRQLGDDEVLATLDEETAREDVHDAGKLVQLCRDLVGRGG